MTRPLAALALAALAFSALAADGPQRLNLDLERARAAEVFRILGELGDQDYVVPGCAADRLVDLQLENVPPALVQEVLANQLDLTYREIDGGTLVVCRDPVQGLDPDVLDQRVSVEVQGASASAVLELLALQAGLAGAEYDAPEVRVDLVLREVRLQTALKALQESTRLAEISVDGDLLVARALRPLTDAPLPEALHQTLDDVLSLTSVDCDGRYDPADRLVTGFTLDAEGRISRSRVLEMEIGDPDLAACVREAVEAWSDPSSGPPVAYAELPIVPGTMAPLPAGAPPRWLLEALEESGGEDLDAGCADGRCRVVGYFPSNGALSSAMVALDAEAGALTLIRIDPVEGGAVRAVLELELE